MDDVTKTDDLAVRVGQEFNAVRSERTRLISTYDANGGQNIDNAPVVISLDTDAHIDTANFSRTGGVVTVLNDGLYRIDAKASLQTINAGGGVRGGPLMEVRRNGTPIPGVKGKDYIRENAGGELSADMSGFQVLNLNANDEITLTLQDTVAAEPNQQTVAEASMMIIQRLT